MDEVEAVPGSHAHFVDKSNYLNLQCSHLCDYGQVSARENNNVYNVVTTSYRIWTCGHNFRKGPIRKGLRQRIISFQFRIAGKIFMMLTGVYWSSSDLDVDYTYYLGPGYKETMSKKYASTIISNHVSWLDGMVIATRVLPSMTPKASLKKTPIVSTLGYAIGNVWIPRGTSQEDRDKALELIKDR